MSEYAGALISIFVVLWRRSNVVNKSIPHQIKNSTTRRNSTIMQTLPHRRTYFIPGIRLTNPLYFVSFSYDLCQLWKRKLNRKLVLNVWACFLYENKAPQARLCFPGDFKMSVSTWIRILVEENWFSAWAYPKLGHLRDPDAYYDTRSLQSILGKIFYSTAGPRNGERRWRNIDCLSFDWIKGHPFQLWSCDRAPYLLLNISLGVCVGSGTYDNLVPPLLRT